jgi:hypothetical protein
VVGKQEEKVEEPRVKGSNLSVFTEVSTGLVQLAGWILEFALAPPRGRPVSVVDCSRSHEPILKDL